MVSRLEDIVQKLQLTELEDEIMYVDDVYSEEKSEQVELCLYGKLLTEKGFNARAMKSVLKNIWKSKKDVIIRDLDSNLFVFQFFSNMDKLFVLNEGPWTFDGKIRLLKEVTSLEKPSEVSFTTTHFWVKAYDLPSKKQTIACAQLIGNKIGTFVDCDEMLMMGVDKSPCSRVDLDISKPLMRGVRLLVAKQPMWIKLGYVKLQDFCYGCDAAIILNIPLRAFLPDDRLIWHCTSDGSFSVRSAYHMIITNRTSASGGPSSPSNAIWRPVWGLNGPPRIKLFGWRLCKGIIPTRFNIAKHVSLFNMSCSIYGHHEETDTHALLECPLAVCILEGSDLDNTLWMTRFRTMTDCFTHAMSILDTDKLGLFVAILWELLLLVVR
ncbi:hypothetical protein Cgig2_019966 [Carnegiea gigantea]|uniref:Reverse transcriptase zinc-binding domain-containing protein n=1 Tax=Carnegiea gigantea TaxID=171969 RepID=A0A9Q1QAC7_9CARY|nr:hypothetical protein Cgig2_019966 [Carnegiea gigantea]